MMIETPGATSANGERDDVARWLADPASHADRPERVELIETHISKVFLTERFVYKLKKPVRFDFLDFSTLAKREQACREEVRLNRRMAAEVYLDAVPITRGASGRLAFGGDGAALDWVVKMRRLPADRMLDELIRSRKLTEIEVDKLADYFARYYGATTPLVVRPRDFHRALVDNVDDNFGALLAAEGVCVEEVRRIHAFQLRLLKCSSELFHARILDGRIIDGHGDLRPEHVCLLSPPAVFDCIEFNETLRHVDVFDELCFLAMECDALDAESVGRRILATYSEQSHDRPPPELEAFFKSYRACVRAKVAMLRSLQLAGTERESQRQLGRRYLKLADRYVREACLRPCLIVVMGLMGTGKSTLARALAAELGIEVVRTDEVRRELFPESGDAAPFGVGKYSAEGRRRVYDETLRIAAEKLSAGNSVILDGTFSGSADRELAYDSALRRGADVVMIRCNCPREVAIDRIEGRLEQEEPDASEARPEHYDRQAAAWEPSRVDDALCVVDTTSSITEQLGVAFEALE